MKKIAVVILNYNGEKDTLECLKSISNLNLNNNELNIVVVDNGSNEELIDNQELKLKNIKIIKNETNLGFSGGNNVGIKYSLQQGAEYVLLLNNDTIADKNLITELLNIADSDKKIGIVSPKIYFEKGYEFHKDRYKKQELGKIIWYAGGYMDWKNVIGFHRGVDEVDKGQYEKKEETEIATGCCMLLKKEVFERIGFFDERYFLYYEDADFSMRTKKEGYRIVFSPKAILWHKNAGSAGGSGSDMQDYYISRNRLLFGYRYASLRSKIALLKESIMQFFLKGRVWQRRGIMDFYLNRLYKGSYK